MRRLKESWSGRKRWTAKDLRWDSILQLTWLTPKSEDWYSLRHLRPSRSTVLRRRETNTSAYVSSSSSSHVHPFLFVEGRSDLQAAAVKRRALSPTSNVSDGFTVVDAPTLLQHRRLSCKPRSQKQDACNTGETSGTMCRISSIYTADSSDSSPCRSRCVSRTSRYVSMSESSSRDDELQVFFVGAKRRSHRLSELVAVNVPHFASSFFLR